MVVTVPFRSVVGAGGLFLLIFLPIAVVAKMIEEWRFTLFLVGLALFAALLARTLSKAFDARYRRTPGTVQHRLHKVETAAYEYELAVQTELGTSQRDARWLARQAAKEAVEADKQRIREEQDQARAEYEADKQRRAAEATEAAARRRDAAEERVADRF